MHHLAECIGFNTQILPHYIFVFRQDIILLVDSIDENRNNELIGGLITFDQDLTHTHVYTLVQNPGQRFVIINSSLYTSSNASLNYEQQQAWVRTLN